jgi:hypothetical protein
LLTLFSLAHNLLAIIELTDRYLRVTDPEGMVLATLTVKFKRTTIDARTQGACSQHLNQGILVSKPTRYFAGIENWFGENGPSRKRESQADPVS